MRPEYLTRKVIINRYSLEILLKRALLDTEFPEGSEAKEVTGAEFADVMNHVLTYMEDALFSSDKDGEV